jgi:protein-glutamine gamma-glutamyltransferase
MKNSTATLCSLALCLWGYQTGAWQFAVPMVLALELRALMKRRWKFPSDYFQGIHVLAAFLWCLAIFYVPPNSPSPIPYAAGYHLIKCLPVGLFSLVLAQTYCPNFTSFYRALFRFPGSNQTINLYYPYLGICLVAASMTGGNTLLFLTVAAVLVTGFLGTVRSQRFSPTTFYSIIALALLISFIGTNQFYWFQANVKLKNPDYFGKLAQKIASISSKETNQVGKNILNSELLKEAAKRAEDLKNSELQKIARSPKSPEASQSPAPNPEANQSPQSTGTSPTAPPPNGSVDSAQGTGGTQSAPSTPSANGSAQSPSGSLTIASANSSDSAPQGSGASQNGTPASGATASSSQTGQSGAVSGAIAALDPSQGGTPSPQGINNAQNQNSPQDTSQSPPVTAQNANGANNAQPGATIVQSASERVDPQKSSTQIGNSGTLVPSDAILFRVSPDSEENRLAPTFPLYIRAATYNQYDAGDWTAAQVSNSPKASQARNRWMLGASTPNTRSVQIATSLRQDENVLKLPVGTSAINNLAVNSMTVNQYGSAIVRGQPGEIEYTAQFDPTQVLDSPPSQLEMNIPVAEQQALQQVIKSLSLRGNSAQETVQTISSFLSNNFQYSLTLPQPQKDTTPLSAFLLKNRAGHCEYFASATSLLLRSVGIPTRYAVGYYVHEYSPSEQSYIVRAQDAHAWVMAYLNGAWTTVDTTPSSGLLQSVTASQSTANAVAETPDSKISKKSANDKTKTPAGVAPTEKDNKAASKDSSFKDLKSFLSKISKAWSSLISYCSKNVDTAIGAGLLIILGFLSLLTSLFFVWRARRKKRDRRLKWRNRSSKVASEPISDGLDSEFYLLEQRLGQRGLDRQPSETIRQWILRLQQKLPESQMNNLNQIIDLHYCYRFDPQGITHEDRAKLKSMIQSWLMETAT